ncbi:MULTISPECIES: quinol:cytochrome C oxidoreductase [Flavobacterium]|uniref:Quinol:cytochrome C oxidoreductase n=1 Tax=Flavobacterium hankyongi TaxID=1176532 RepID=A0ABP8ZKZ4_9FLAO|nr:quinol:cytochrome C oxidoreductase [Flavobacterium sp. N1846]
MYTLSSKIKTIALTLMVLGLLGIAYGFFSAPKNTEDVEKILAADSHGGGHHETAATNEATEEHHEVAPVAHAEESHAVEAGKDSTAVVAQGLDSVVTHVEEAHASVEKSAHETSEAKGHDVAEHDAHAEHKEHVEHVFHQLQNKPWAALYVGALFIFLISLGVLAFYAIQWAAQAGWSPALFRVMEAITAYLVPGGIIIFVLLVLSGVQMNHLFIWMDPAVAAEDHLIQGKSGFLNVPFYLIRAAVFLGGWILYRTYTRKNSIALDETHDLSYYKKNFKASAGFLAFFLVSESIMSWDWVMSVDPHWYSTLFGWYVFASFFVSGITTIALITLYLKSQGYLEFINNSHFHDLAKFMFGISVFWTYLWFSQFMLMWYSNIPEEVTYFKMRIEHYNLPFFGMVIMNFVFPILILINTDFKRVPWIITMAGIIILSGHYLDFHNMIYPATVGDQWFIGVAELGSVAFFAGLFIYVVFSALTKAPLLAKGNPLIEESKHFHY